MTDRTTTRVSSNAHTTLSRSFPYTFPPHVYGSMLQKRLRSEDSHQPFFDTGSLLACRHRSSTHVPISRLAPRTVGRPSWKTYSHFTYLFPIQVLAHIPPSMPFTSRSSESARMGLYTFYAVVFAEPSLSAKLQNSQIRVHPEFPALIEN
jgi:hypothetical protein